MERQIHSRIGTVVIEDVDLPLLLLYAFKIDLVVMEISKRVDLGNVRFGYSSFMKSAGMTRRSELKILTSVLPLCELQRQCVINQDLALLLCISRLPECLQRRPKVLPKALVVRITILRNDGLDMAGVPQCQTESDRSSIVEDIHGVHDFELIKPGANDKGHVFEGVLEVWR